MVCRNRSLSESRTACNETATNVRMKQTIRYMTDRIDHIQKQNDSETGAIDVLVSKKSYDVTPSFSQKQTLSNALPAAASAIAEDTPTVKRKLFHSDSSQFDFKDDVLKIIAHVLEKAGRPQFQSNKQEVAVMHRLSSKATDTLIALLPGAGKLLTFIVPAFMYP